MFLKYIIKDYFQNKRVPYSTHQILQLHLKEELVKQDMKNCDVC
jgi:hypothetical protein